MNSDFCVAVHALVYLNRKAEVVSSEELAKNICTHPARVRKVLSKLKRAGLVTTKEGIEGGYRFVGNPESITLDEVSKALDVRFVESSWHSGDSDMDCLIASGIAKIMDGIYEDLDKLCKDHLKTVTIQTIDDEIFHKNK
jgi:Rrf2 family protein